MKKVLLYIITVVVLTLTGCAQGADTAESLKITPEYLSKFQSERVLTVELLGSGEFRDSIGSSDISLSQGIAGLTVVSVNWLNAKTIRVTLSGEAAGILADPDYGFLTVSQQALYTGNTAGKDVRGKVRIGTPQMVQTSFSSRNQEVSISYAIEGGEWKKNLNLMEDIQIGGVLAKAESVELKTEAGSVTLSFHQVPESGEGTITFKSSASSLKSEVKMTVKV